MSARFLDAAARAAFQRAIETIEGGSAAEVVVAVRRRSASYLHANLLVGATVTFLALAAMLFSAEPFGYLSILFDPFLVGLAAGALVEAVPPVKRLCTLPSVRRRMVALAAHAAFFERGVHRTRGRSGLIVYISWLEREVAVVADLGIEDAMSPAALRELAAGLTAAVPRGGAAVAARLEAAASALAGAIPRGDRDRNELPDALHTDLALPEERR